MSERRTSVSRKSVNVWCATAAVCAWLAGCGGGGGGGAPSESPSPAPAPAADEPTLGLFNQSGPYASLTLSAASQLQNLAQFTVDISQRMARAGVANPLAVSCPLSGSLSLRLLDRDNNGRASPGDQITAVFDHCSLPLLQLSATGTAVVELQAGSSPALDTDVRAVLQVSDVLVLERSPYRVSLGWTPAGVRGSLAVAWTSGDTRTRLSMQSTTADDLRFDANPVQGMPPIELRKIATAKEVRFDEGNIVHTLDFHLLVGIGRAVVQPTPALTLDLGGYPRSGAVSVLAAGGQSLRITGPGTFSTSWNVDKLGADGTVLENRFISADVEQGTLGWNGRRTVTTTYGPGYSAGSGLEFPGGLQAEYIGPNASDPLFLHPLVRPRVDDAAPVIRVQAHSPYVTTPTGYQWRLRDDSLGLDDASPAWNLPLQATVSGALIKLAAAEPLRYGRTYILESSPDGVDWVTQRELPLTDGNTQRLGGMLATLYVPSTLVIDPPRFQRAVISAQNATLLSPNATTTDGATVVRWQWAQLDGAPLVLDTPGQRETLVRLPGTGPWPFGLSTLLITATDSLGRSQRARLVVKQGTVAPSGELHYRVYRDTRLDPQRLANLQLHGGAATGLGSTSDFFPANTAILGSQSRGFTQLVRMADAAPFAVGRYSATVRLPVPAGVAYLGCFDLPDCPADAEGSFDVLEAGTAADGSVNRLALDYEVTSPSLGSSWSARGSYRLNSSLPIRP